jgi:hypothetical protein
MATSPAIFETSFTLGSTEVRRYSFPVPVSVGTRIVLDGEGRDKDGDEGKDLRVLDVKLDLNDTPVLVVEIGEQRGPGLTPV